MLPEDSQDVWHSCRKSRAGSCQSKEQCQYVNVNGEHYCQTLARGVTLYSHVTSPIQQLCKKSVDLCKPSTSDASGNRKGRRPLKTSGALLLDPPTRSVVWFSPSKSSEEFYTLDLCIQQPSQWRAINNSPLVEWRPCPAPWTMSCRRAQLWLMICV